MTTSASTAARSGSKPRVVVLDYGSGNLRSAQRALEAAGAEVEVTRERTAAMEAAGLVVPGVGAFAACMDGLRGVRADELIGRRLAGDRPVLAICVGMQVMFERGVEHGTEAAGCAEWPGAVERLDAPVLPHMGWNTVTPGRDSRLFAGIENERFYFVHSYGARSWPMPSTDTPLAPGHWRKPAVVSWAEHGEPFIAAVEDGPLSGTQFHPEKSGEAGAALLRNWLGTL